MQAVITGATGLVGSNLSIRLLELGHSVRCTRRRSSKIEHLRDFDIEWVEADLGDSSALAAAFSDADVIFHCAAAISTLPRPTPLLIKTNVEGTRNVLEAVRVAGVKRLVYCSSIAARAVATGDDPVDETTPWNFAQLGMDDGYVITKRQAEQLVLEAAATDIDAVVVNPTLVLGPYDPKPSSGRLIVEVIKGTSLGYTSGCNNFVDVRDVCDGMIAAWQKGRRGECYILGNTNLGYREAMQEIARIAGVKPPRFPVPYVLARVAGLAGDLLQRVIGREVLINSVLISYGFCKGYRFSSAKARNELGYAPRPFEVTIHDAIAWFRERGMLE